MAITSTPRSGWKRKLFLIAPLAVAAWFYFDQTQSIVLKQDCDKRIAYLQSKHQPNSVISFTNNSVGEIQYYELGSEEGAYAIVEFIPLAEKIYCLPDKAIWQQFRQQALQTDATTALTNVLQPHECTCAADAAKK